MDLLWEIFGDRRVLYGSNWPVSNRLAPYQAVHRVVSDYVQARGRAVAESFFWRNSLAVYRWVWRGGHAVSRRPPVGVQVWAGASWIISGSG
jgi:hypothetical protein